jgi:hypothetical protein
VVAIWTGLAREIYTIGMITDDKNINKIVRMAVLINDLLKEM